MKLRFRAFIRLEMPTIQRAEPHGAANSERLVSFFSDKPTLGKCNSSQRSSQALISSISRVDLGENNRCIYQTKTAFEFVKSLTAELRTAKVRAEVRWSFKRTVNGGNAKFEAARFRPVMVLDSPERQY